MKRLNGKTAVITGGATGIGRAAAKRFIEEGAFVFIFGRRKEALDAAVAELGPNARAVQGSVSNPADLDGLFAAIKAERGTLDIVFANAGVGSPLALGKLTAEHIDEIFDTNVKGLIFTVQKALSLMGRGWFDYSDRIERRHHGRPRIQRLQREQSGHPQPRAVLVGGPEGHRHSGQRAVAWADSDRPREGCTGRGRHESVRLDESAAAHGRTDRDRGGGSLSRLAGQQLYDRQRGRG